MQPDTLRRFSVLLIAICVVVVVVAWQRSASRAMTAWDPDRARAADMPIPVRTARVEERDLSETIGGTAVTVPARTATIALPMASSEAIDRLVTSVLCESGAEVDEGQKLLEFDRSLFEQVVEQRQAMLDRANQELETMARLYRSNSASGLQLKAAEVSVKSAELELGLAQRDLDLCSITSPLEGVVQDVTVVPQMRLSGAGTLATIHQLDPIYIQMDFPMERIDSLSVGQSAEVVLDAFSQETFEGEVVQIAPVVATKTRVLPVIIEVPNPNNRIRAGISGFARIAVDKPEATAVPSVAVIKNQQRAMVVRVVDERAELQEVKTGAVTRAGYTEVIEGLESGDEVVVYGHGDVDQNDAVNVDWRAWTRRESSIEVTP